MVWRETPKARGAGAGATPSRLPPVAHCWLHDHHPSPDSPEVTLRTKPQRYRACPRSSQNTLPALSAWKRWRAQTQSSAPPSWTTSVHQETHRILHQTQTQPSFRSLLAFPPRTCAVTRPSLTLHASAFSRIAHTGNPLGSLTHKSTLKQGWVVGNSTQPFCQCSLTIPGAAGKTTACATELGDF